MCLRVNALLPLVAIAASALCLSGSWQPADLGNLPQKGCFTCDLVLDAQQTPFAQAAGLFEIDRMEMTGSVYADGMKHKIIPFNFPTFDPAYPNTLVIYAGGRYLFDTSAEARIYEDFVKNKFVLDGTLFLQRPVFLASDCHSWEVVAASEFIDDYIHRSLRTERWAVSGDALPSLRASWPAVEAEAQRRGYAAVWLIYNPTETLAELVTFDEGLDLITDRLLRPTLGKLVEQPGWSKALDRDQYVLTNWQPFLAGDHGVPSAWPNYPLIPIQPSCGDGVCEPSRGETNANCVKDCVPGCGDAVCGPGEHEHNCPGDCQLYSHR